MFLCCSLTLQVKQTRAQTESKFSKMFYKGSSITSHIADKLATEAALGECPSTITVQKASKTDSVKESSETTEEQDKAGQTPVKQKKQGHCHHCSKKY